MDVIAEARAAYVAGRLVPFLGSGVSLPVCRSWPGMVVELERLAQITWAPDDPPRVDDLALANRAAQALDRRRLNLRIPAADSVRDSLLEDGPAGAPAATTAVAELHWPLVLTTNY